MVKSAPDRGSECLEFVHQLSPALSARFSKNEPGSLPICRGIFEIGLNAKNVTYQSQEEMGGEPS